MTPIISMTSINARDTVKTPAGASSWWQKETWLYSNIFCMSIGENFLSYSGLGMGCIIIVLVYQPQL